MARNEDTPENNDNLMEELLDKVNKMEREIADLKKQFNDNQQNYYPPLPVFGVDMCNDGGIHTYPNPWHSIMPPNCLKCGKQAPSNSITFTNYECDHDWVINNGGTAGNSRTCKKCNTWESLDQFSYPSFYVSEPSNQIPPYTFTIGDSTDK